MSSSHQPLAERPAVGRGTTATCASEAFDTTESCNECGGTSFNRGDAGEWFCRDCGVVLSRPEVEFTEPGWRPKTERRTGPATTINRLSVGTIVGNDGGGKPSWAKYNDRLNHKQRTLRHGLGEVRSLATALEASGTVSDRASYLFRRATTEGLLVGHSIEAIAAACLHAAARDTGTPFALPHIAEKSAVDKSAINSAFHKVVRELELPIAPPEPSEFVPRIATDVAASIGIRERALEIIDQLVDDEKHIGQSPAGVAAAALYGAFREKDGEITQAELADAAYVSVVTLSRQWQSVEEYVA